MSYLASIVSLVTRLIHSPSAFSCDPPTQTFFKISRPDTHPARTVVQWNLDWARVNGTFAASLADFCEEVNDLPLSELVRVELYSVPLRRAVALRRALDPVVERFQNRPDSQPVRVDHYFGNKISVIVYKELEVEPSIQIFSAQNISMPLARFASETTPVARVGLEAAFQRAYQKGNKSF